MKIKIMMMLAAVLIIGAAEATRYQSATTFVGDITMREAGIEMAGERISDVVWSSYGWYMFDGTTGTELEAFIDANGPGTYFLCNPITISAAEDPITISTDYVRLMGGTVASNIDWGTDQSGTIKFTGTSGTGMIITGVVDFVNIKFRQVNSGLGCMVEARQRQTLDGCSFWTLGADCYKITGVGDTGPTFSVIQNCYFVGKYDSPRNAGTGIVLGDSTNMVYSPYIHQCWFCFLEKDLALYRVAGLQETLCYHLAGVESDDNPHLCVYIHPLGGDLAVIDSDFDRVIFDYSNDAPAVYSGDSPYTHKGYTFSSCYFWSNNSNAIKFTNCTHDVRLWDCIFGAGKPGLGGDAYPCIEFATETDDVQIVGGEMYQWMSGPGIAFYHGGTDIQITDFRVKQPLTEGNSMQFDNPTVHCVVTDCICDNEIEFNGAGSDYIICQNNICDEAVDDNSGGTHKVIGDNLVF